MLNLRQIQHLINGADTKKDLAKVNILLTRAWIEVGKESNEDLQQLYIIILQGLNKMYAIAETYINHGKHQIFVDDEEYTRIHRFTHPHFVSLTEICKQAMVEKRMMDKERSTLYNE